MAKKLEITKKSSVKGEDGYKVFSVRVREETIEKLDELSVATNRSRNELINLILEFGVENCEIKDTSK